MLRARMQLPQENTAIARGDILACFRGGTHFRKLLGRHDKQKLMSRFGQKNEFLRAVASPTRGNGDSIFVVDGMPEFSGIEAFGLRIGVHRSGGATVHFAPLDPTFNHLHNWRSTKIFAYIARRCLPRKLLTRMKFFRFRLAIGSAVFISGSAILFGQSPDSDRTDAVRVTMSMHPDGSRTVYNFDGAQRKAVATTTDADGRVRETIRYDLDAAGRFAAGEISGPDGRLKFKSGYKYNDTGRLLEETQTAPDGALLHKIVYNYDSGGKQTGYSVFDASGKLVGRTGAVADRASPSPKKTRENAPR